MSLFDTKTDLRPTCYCLLQRDLDFTLDVDFHGELSEMIASMTYKMR